METLQAVLLVLLVMVSIGLIALILLQHGKGADAGAAFGSGASATVFGARGSSSFLSRSTAGLALAFFAISLTLAYLAAHRPRADGISGSVVESVETAPGAELPAVDGGLPEAPPPALDQVPDVPVDGLGGD